MEYSNDNSSSKDTTRLLASYMLSLSLIPLNEELAGDERTWKNADSGNHGIVHLIDIYSE